MAEPFFSPTVAQAYGENPEWWDDFGGSRGIGVDYDGYDRYGFDRLGIDRAGWKAGHYADGKLSASCRREAAVAGAALAASQARRMPGRMSRAIVDRTVALLSERFPELPHVADPVTGDGHEERDAAVMTGVNASRDPYAGAYFIRKHIYFSVIAEVRSPLSGRPGGWSATVMRNDGGEVMEKAIAGKESLDALMEAVAEELVTFRPLAEPHAVYMSGAGTAEASFGAMPEAEWEALGEGERPGDRIATACGETPAEALRCFAAAESRSEAFTEMVERGLAASPDDRKAPRP